MSSHFLFFRRQVRHPDRVRCHFFELPPSETLGRSNDDMEFRVENSHDAAPAVRIVATWRGGRPWRSRPYPRENRGERRKVEGGLGRRQRTRAEHGTLKPGQKLGMQEESKKLGKRNLATRRWGRQARVGTTGWCTYSTVSACAHGESLQGRYLTDDKTQGQEERSRSQLQNHAKTMLVQAFPYTYSTVSRKDHHRTLPLCACFAILQIRQMHSARRLPSGPLQS